MRMRLAPMVIMAALVLGGTGCLPRLSQLPAKTVPFGAPVELSVGQTMTFNDGLQATLVEINDSRCAPGVECIWAGELSPTLHFSQGHLSAATDLRLGPISNSEARFDIYTVKLVESTETTATISVVTAP